MNSPACFIAWGRGDLHLVSGAPSTLSDFLPVIISLCIDQGPSVTITTFGHKAGGWVGPFWGHSLIGALCVCVCVTHVSRHLLYAHACRHRHVRRHTHSHVYTFTSVHTHTHTDTYTDTHNWAAGYMQHFKAPSNLFSLLVANVDLNTANKYEACWWLFWYMSSRGFGERLRWAHVPQFWTSKRLLLAHVLSLVYFFIFHFREYCIMR